MKNKALIISIIVVVILVSGGGYLMLNSDRLEFQNVCSSTHKRYTKLCDNIGKDAWSIKSILKINEVNYGKIIGVAWREKGDSISSRNHKHKRYSKTNSYYYIIGDSKKPNTQYLRLHTEVESR